MSDNAVEIIEADGVEGMLLHLLLRISAYSSEIYSLGFYLLLIIFFQ